MKTAKRTTYSLIFTSAAAAGLLMAVFIHEIATNSSLSEFKAVDQTVTIMAKRMSAIEKITYDQKMLAPQLETAEAATRQVNPQTKPAGEQTSTKRLQTNAEFNKIMRKFA